MNTDARHEARFAGSSLVRLFSNEGIPHYQLFFVIKPQTITSPSEKDVVISLYSKRYSIRHSTKVDIRVSNPFLNTLVWYHD